MLLFVALAVSVCVPARSQEPVRVILFDHVVFYDGYKQEVVDKDAGDGILRFRNSLYAVRIPENIISDMGRDLRMPAGRIPEF